MIVETRKLGLSAFIKMHDGKLLKYYSGRFVFETKTSLEEWEVRYLNSCCNKHDTELINLRKLLR